VPEVRKVQRDSRRAILPVRWRTAAESSVSQPSATLEQRLYVMNECIGLLKVLNPRDQLQVWLAINTFLSLNSVHPKIVDE
jgi:hypothetical protein